MNLQPTTIKTKDDNEEVQNKCRNVYSSITNTATAINHRNITTCSEEYISNISVRSTTYDTTRSSKTVNHVEFDNCTEKVLLDESEKNNVYKSETFLATCHDLIMK